MKNLGNMMKQAQQMQGRMAEMQEEMEAYEVEGSAASGKIAIRLTGKFEVRGVSIDPQLIDPSDPEMLEALVLTAFNDAKGKIDPSWRAANSFKLSLVSPKTTSMRA